MPIHPRYKRSRPVKQILPVVQIKHRISAIPLLVIAGRQIDDQVSAIPQKSRRKLLVFDEIGRTHLAMESWCFTRGSAKRIGTPKFEPPNPFTIATVTPITPPCRFRSGPPEPPEVVCASYTILPGTSSPTSPYV